MVITDIFSAFFRILMSYFNIYFHVVLAYYHEWRHNKMVYSKIIRVSAFLCHFHLCNWHQRSACEASKMANYKRWSFPRIVHFNGKSRFGINMLYVNHKGNDTPWGEDRRLFTVISKMMPCGIEFKLRLCFVVLTCSNRNYICFHGYIQCNKFNRTDSVASSVKMAEYVFKALMGENIGMLNIYFDTCLRLAPRGYLENITAKYTL